MSNTPIDLRPEEVAASFLNPVDAKRVWMSGDEYSILIDAKASGGMMTLIGALVPPGGGPPVHVHLDKDELFVVTHGSLDIVVDGSDCRVNEGGRVFVPRGVPHAFTNRTSAPARALLFFTPGGIEEFFLAAGIPAVEGEAPPTSTPESVAREVAVAARFQTLPPAQWPAHPDTWDVIGDNRP